VSEIVAMKSVHFLLRGQYWVPHNNRKFIDRFSLLTRHCHRLRRLLLGLVTCTTATSSLSSLLLSSLSSTKSMTASVFLSFLGRVFAATIFRRFVDDGGSSLRMDLRMCKCNT
jgi:hypothetical protein